MRIYLAPTFSNSKALFVTFMGTGPGFAFKNKPIIRIFAQLSYLASVHKVVSHKGKEELVVSR